MLRFVCSRFSKEILDYSKTASSPLHRSVKCLVLHPVFHPNRGPEAELYQAEEAVGLAKSLNWSITKGPFWRDEFTSEVRKSMGKPEVKEVKDEDQNQTAPVGRNIKVNSKEHYEAVKREGWEFCNETKMKNGEYVHIPGFSGIYQNGYLLADISSESDDDLAHEWRNKILRNSIAKSSLVKVPRIHSSTFFTKGKVQSLGDFIRENGVNAIFVNHELTPLQTRNLERIWTDIMNDEAPRFPINSNDPENSDLPTDQETDGELQQQQETHLKVFDRYTMILQIFAKRSMQGVARLQIELSFLRFARTRLVRSGQAFVSLTSIFKGDLMSAREVHLEVVSAKQQRAVGKLSGSGESQLELQRRKIDERMAELRKEIEHMSAQSAKLRKRKDSIVRNIPKIALIGYTNAGKSALLNCILQKEAVESEDLLFQTLSTTQRKIRLKTGQKAMMLDTIGFISDLPHDLVESFKSTLLEVSDADLVLHIRDISHPCTELQKKVVLEVLKDLKFDQEFYTKRMIEVWNKIDLLKSPINYDLIENEGFPIVPISALHKTNVNKLLQVMEEKSNLIMNKKIYKFRHKIDDHFDRLKWLYDNGNITGIQNELYINPNTKSEPTEVTFEALLDEPSYNRYKATFEPEERERRKKNKGMPPPDW